MNTSPTCKTPKTSAENLCKIIGQKFFGRQSYLEPKFTSFHKFGCQLSRAKCVKYSES